ncbi:protein PHOTOSYSTEM I ASSEMBLY 2, chloroplastic-like isoform X2 [Juglans regia]|uniref:Protein PHOTOSYSTEM I ASSEMBLY 2, chloroplastic-like isoform X2 n=1 Tax=Juglans regia TaxID=51240 RepID=A0A2I4HK29_JUGRE|nr:protein PHOTOSYSTEM I ASSEMBLY 2, chloroplastic-like isoform X2 [Juglans regia]
MAELSLCCNSLTPRALPPRPVQHPRSSPSWIPTGGLEQRRGTRAAFAAKPGGFSLNSISKSCQTCRGKGAIECPGCKGTGKNKKNGNIFERWKCFDCQGFGLKSCPRCGQGGLTPEQRGER